MNSQKPTFHAEHLYVQRELVPVQGRAGSWAAEVEGRQAVRSSAEQTFHFPKHKQSKTSGGPRSRGRIRHTHRNMRFRPIVA